LLSVPIARKASTRPSSTPKKARLATRLGRLRGAEIDVASSRSSTLMPRRRAASIAARCVQWA
jgi:hypothetical protein